MTFDFGSKDEVSITSPEAILKTKGELNYEENINCIIRINECCFYRRL